MEYASIVKVKGKGPVCFYTCSLFYCLHNYLPGVVATHTLSQLTPWGELLIMQHMRRTINWHSPGTHHCWVARGILEWNILPHCFLYANEHRWIRSSDSVTARLQYHCVNQPLCYPRVCVVNVNLQANTYCCVLCVKLFVIIDCYSCTTGSSEWSCQGCRFPPDEYE